MLEPDKDIQEKHMKYVIVCIALTTLLAAFLCYFFKTDRVYTHLFYVPIAMSAIWMPKKTLLIGVFFAFYHILLELAYHTDLSPSVICRSLVIVLITIILNEVWKIETNYQTRLHTLTYMSHHDEMTHIYNRAYFDLILASELNYPITILIVDVDGLKKINDKFGHGVGDEHILAASYTLQRSIRFGDILARIGGDEFAIIAQACGNECALDIILRIEKQLNEYNIKIETSKRLSLSVGYKTNMGTEPIFKTIDIADQNMYAVKKRKYEGTMETAK